MPPWTGGRLVNTTSFRLALMGATLSALAACIVFAIIYFATAGSLRAQLDRDIRNEIAELPAAGSPVLLRQAVDQAVHDAPPNLFYALVAADGQKLAGNVRPARIYPGWHTYRADRDRLPPKIDAMRGFAVQTLNGSILLVAENASALVDLNEIIIQAFGFGFGVTLLLGLAGGALVGRSSLRQIEAISAASREIMAGDLSRRIEPPGRGDEYDHLAASLNAMLARIERLMGEVRNATNDIAHDMRSPLARLRETLELARRRALDKSEFDMVIDESLVQLDECLSRFSAMLRLAQIETGSRRAGFATIDLSALLRNLAETYEIVAEEGGQSLTHNIAPGSFIEGDRDLLNQLFANLIENAIRHAGPTAHIDLHAQGRIVHISDDGPGIPSAEHARIFQRFVRLDQSRHSPGSGLGLAIVAAIAELHDAEVRIENRHPGVMIEIKFS
jgi:signal transduction histidine kinase